MIVTAIDGGRTAGAVPTKRDQRSTPKGRSGLLRCLSFVLALAALSLPMASVGLAADKSEVPGSVSLQVDNDLFGSGSDSHYTQGMRLSWLPSEETVPDWARQAAVLMPGIDYSDHFTFVFSLGQNMYTPEDISTTEPDPTDRPYAGWLYFTMGAVIEDSDLNMQHNLSLDIGVVGPLSFADRAQTIWHEWIGSPKPQGWDHQLDNEPGLVLNYGVAQRTPIVDAPAVGLEMDVTPRAGFALGNVFTYAGAGAALRIGHNLDLDYGPPFIRPSLPGGSLMKRRGEWGWYLFAGVEGRAVARNIFLDGNTFADSPSVDREPFIGDFQFGATGMMGPFRLSFTQIIRTEEFEGQDGPDHFGSISLTYLF